MPLWERLRKLRMTIAREQGVPPFVVFHDSTLKAMVHAMPANHDDLLQISGIGEKKAAQYGKQFLEIINNHPMQTDRQ